MPETVFKENAAKVAIGFFSYIKVFENTAFGHVTEVPIYSIPKKFRDEVDFFDADKHQSFLTVDFNTLGIKVLYSVTGMIMKM